MPSQTLEAPPPDSQWHCPFHLGAGHPHFLYVISQGPSELMWGRSCPLGQHASQATGTGSGHCPSPEESGRQRLWGAGLRFSSVSGPASCLGAGRPPVCPPADRAPDSWEEPDTRCPVSQMRGWQDCEGLLSTLGLWTWPAHLCCPVPPAFSSPPFPSSSSSAALCAISNFISLSCLFSLSSLS